MPDESDPYELNDDPFEDQDAPDAGEPDEPEPATNDLEQLAAAAGDRSAAISGDQPMLDASGRLDEDIHCRSCGYNLRGQAPNGSCPECGAPVDQSLGSNHLRFANTQWVKSLYTGASFLSIGTLCMIPLSCLVGGIASAFVTTNTTTPGTFNAPATPTTASIMAEAVSNMILTIAALVVTGYGMWKLCQPEPGVESTESDATSRLLARWLVLPAYAVSCFVGLFYFIPDQTVLTVVSIIDGVVGIAGGVGWLAHLLYLRKLAMRIPDESLASQAAIIFWGLIGMLVLIVPVFIGSLFFGFSMLNSASPNPMAALGPIVVCACLGALVFLGLMIWWIVLMFMFRSAFERGLRHSTR